MSGTVLVVDDEASVRQLLSQLLQSLGLQVLTAPDGLAAIEVYRDNLPNLVVTDVYMPRLDGLGMVQALTRDFPDIKVVFISGYFGDTPDKMEFRNKVGALGHPTLSKPFAARDLIEKIKQLMP